MREKLTTTFKTAFHDRENSDLGSTRLFFAPGRVNLIGEHIDYNGGFVFPVALSLGTYALILPRQDNQVRVYSMNFPDQGVQSFLLDDLVYDEKHDWANYPKGVLSVFADKGYVSERGFDAVFYGTIPNGAGLSSSASIEVLTATIWNTLNDFQVDPINLVKLCQQAENSFIGINCGIMDQFSIGLGKKDYAILLDCESLNYEYHPLKLDEFAIVIANTNKRRGLADSKYNERRGECETALGKLQEKHQITSLCELDSATFEKDQEIITDEIHRKRARHAIFENERTIQAAKSLTEGDLKKFGQLLNESHLSLRDDYEVTGKELDSLVKAAWDEETVIGARMTGAGFGGCTVNIIHKDQLDEVMKRIGDKYQKETGLEAMFYVAESGQGPHEIT
ncbi:galactokinase [Bacillus alkalicola]|uniref:Galactokinase n=1 Tax=Evansella alkalicola TaxID=745819 RepID=A0ABS6K050_9BACI|nr:galactokinase [Bacillus alkalicola]